MNPPSTRLYVGGLPPEVPTREVEDQFNKYGRLQNVWIARNPPGFAFLEYEDPRDAKDAVRIMNGREFMGRTLKVEFSKSAIPGLRHPGKDQRMDERRSPRDIHDNMSRRGPPRYHPYRLEEPIRRVDEYARDSRERYVYIEEDRHRRPIARPVRYEHEREYERTIPIARSRDDSRERFVTERHYARREASPIYEHGRSALVRNGGNESLGTERIRYNQPRYERIISRPIPSGKSLPNDENIVVEQGRRKEQGEEGEEAEESKRIVMSHMSEFPVRLNNLPKDVDYHELNDFVNAAAHVRSFTITGQTAIAVFGSQTEAENAIRKLDDIFFAGSYIRAIMDDGSEPSEDIK